MDATVWRNTERPVAFASRILHEAEKNYSIIHKEALAIGPWANFSNI